MQTPPTIPPKSNAARPKTRGATLLIVIGLGLILMIFLFAVIGRGQTEQRLTDRTVRLNEAYNAAESVANYGIADIGERFLTRVFLPPNEFRTNPLTIPSTTFFDGAYVDTGYLELIGGAVPAAQRVYIDPNNPANRKDPLIRSMVDSVNIDIYSRASATPTLQQTNPTKSFLRQQLLVRFVNLTDALFYNMDLELHPGPFMTFKGKVHTNGDFWVMADGGLDFYDTVTAAGEIIHGYKYTGGQSSAHRGDVRFVNGSNNLVSMRLNTANTNTSWVYNRPGAPVWVEESDRRWEGNVKDSAHDVGTRNPAGIPAYVPDNLSTPANELENHAYAIVEPLLPFGHTNRKSAAGRQQKMNARACLIFRVEQALAGDPQFDGLTVKAYTWQRTTTARPINSQAPFDGTMSLNGNGDPTLVPVYLPPGLIGAMNANGRAENRVVDYYNQATGAVETRTISTYISGVNDDGKPEQYVISGTSVLRGMREQRELVNLSPITIDVARLRDLVDPRAHPARTADQLDDFWIDPTDPTFSVTFDPQTQWNGVIYVEFPTVGFPSHGTTSRVDNIVATDVKGLGLSGATNLSLQVVNGHTIPNAPTQTDTSVTASDRFVTANPGFTIGTNGPLYLIGNYNSDGKTTGAADIPDTWVDAKGRTYLEPPAGIVCDSFTILSKYWIPGAQALFGGGTRNNRALSNGSSSSRTTAFTEISASVMTGLKPTDPASGVISGGAHNFPRFLENWSGVSCRLRTSLNAMFESEAHTRAMPASPTYYSPPNRDWGQPDQAANPLLIMIPPAWIQVIDFRMGGITPMSEADYEAAVAPLR